MVNFFDYQGFWISVHVIGRFWFSKLAVIESYDWLVFIPGFGCHFSLCMASPLRSLGSNHVVFGGMMLPESAMSTNCFIETG